jgi:hypothetical protein
MTLGVYLDNRFFLRIGLAEGDVGPAWVVKYSCMLFSSVVRLMLGAEDIRKPCRPKVERCGREHPGQAETCGARLVLWERDIV